MMNPLFLNASALRSILARSPPRSRCVKKTKGPRAATRLAAPWRQGTETGSGFIVLSPISTVNSQRQLGELRKDK